MYKYGGHIQHYYWISYHIISHHIISYHIRIIWLSTKANFVDDQVRCRSKKNPTPSWPNVCILDLEGEHSSNSKKKSALKSWHLNKNFTESFKEKLNKSSTKDLFQQSSQQSFAGSLIGSPSRHQWALRPQLTGTQLNRNSGLELDHWAEKSTSCGDRHESYPNDVWPELIWHDMFSSFVIFVPYKHHQPVSDLTRHRWRAKRTSYATKTVSDTVIQRRNGKFDDICWNISWIVDQLQRHKVGEVCRYTRRWLCRRCECQRPPAKALDPKTQKHLVGTSKITWIKKMTSK